MTEKAALTLPDSRPGRCLDQHMDVIGLVTDGVEAAVQLAQEEDLGFPLATFPDDAVGKEYKIARVPQTLMIDSSGKVRSVYHGALDDESEQEILGLVSEGLLSKWGDGFGSESTRTP